MQLNKVRVYRPNSISGGGAGSIVDDPYNVSTWNSDATQGASRNSISDKIESMGYSSGKIIYIDSIYGSDTFGQKGNILKPFKTLNNAISYSSSGDLMVVFPGTYTLGSFGLPLRNGVDYYILDANFVHSGFGYGLIMVFPFSVTCKIFGKGTFTDSAPVGGWAMITPYNDCNLEIEGMTFISNKQMIGQLGGVGINKFLKFKNCKLVSNDNDNMYYSGGGFGVGSASFEDCYLKANWLVNNAAMCPTYDFKVKFSRCELVANDSNTNGDICFLRLVEYYGNDEFSKVFLDHCILKSSTHNIAITEGYGGIGTNKFLIIKDCYFYNTSGSGWIRSEHANAQFKLINNWSQYSQSGSVPVVNMLVGAGITIDSNLE